MLRAPVHQSGFPADQRAPLPIEDAADAPSLSAEDDFYGAMSGCHPIRSSSTSAAQLEPERPRYHWEHIPPRLAPERVDHDLLGLAGNDDFDDIDYYEPMPARPTSCWWDSSPRPTERLSVSINTSSGRHPLPAPAAIEDRRPGLHHSGGGLAAPAAAAAAAAAAASASVATSQIAIGLPSSREPHSGRIQLEISGCPAATSVTVSVTRHDTRASSRASRTARHATVTNEDALIIPPPPSSVSAAAAAAAEAAAEASAAGCEADDEKALASALSYLRASGWYYGALSWQQAQLCLQGTAEGTFLARDSYHRRFVFALSVQTAHGPTSVRVQLTGGRFRLDAPAELLSTMPTFEDMNALVEHYTQQDSVTLNGRPPLTMRLGRPLLCEVPSLQHCCRLALNRLDVRQRQLAQLPGQLQHYMLQYPYRR